jgi:galactokinase
MAVEVDILLAVKVQHDQQPPRIRISNVNDAKFAAEDFEIPSNGEVEIDHSTLRWTNYFRAGLRGASGLLQKKHGASFSAVGMDVLVLGTVPSGGGLSSSAAFVCASALAVLTANGEAKVDRKELVELAIVSERAVGVNSGG